MTQTLQNATKHEFWVPWFVSGAFVANSSNNTSWHKLLQKYTSSAHFAPSLVQQRNDPKCTQTLRNATKHEFCVPWYVSGAFIEKSSDATSCHEFLHYLHKFGPFCTESSAVAKRSQMHPNIMKHTKTCV